MLLVLEVGLENSITMELNLYWYILHALLAKELQYVVVQQIHFLEIIRALVYGTFCSFEAFDYENQLAWVNTRFIKI